MVGASGSAGSSKLRKVAKPEPSMTFSIRRAPRPALPAWRVPGRTRPVCRWARTPAGTAPGTSSEARPNFRVFGFPRCFFFGLCFFFAWCVEISSGEPATSRRSGPNCAFRPSYRTAFESCWPPPLPKIPPTSVAIATMSLTVNGWGPSGWPIAAYSAGIMVSAFSGLCAAEM